MDPSQPNNLPQDPSQPGAAVPGSVPQETTGQVPGMTGSDAQTPLLQPAYQTPVTPPVPMYGSPGQPMGPGVSPISQPSGTKTIIIVAAAVVLVGVLGGGAFLLLHKSGSNPVAKVTSTIKGTSDVVDRKDSTLDLTTLIDKQDTIKAQDLKAKLNQQVNLSDATSYMVTGVERNFVSTSRYLKADDGKELIKISLVVGNRSKEDTLYFTDSMFKIRNSVGGLQSPEYATSDDLADVLSSNDIAAGKQVKGSIVFQVDKGEKITALVTSDTYKNYSDEKEVAIKSEVALQ